MARIPTYERQPETQMLGSTAKLSGSDPAASALQNLGGAIQDVGQAVNHIQQVKNDSASDFAEADDIKFESAAEQEFTKQLIALDSSLTIDQKPKWMADRRAERESDVAKNWRGDDKSLNDYLGKMSVVNAKRTKAYEYEVLNNQIEGAIVNKQVAISTALSANDFGRAEEHLARLGQIAGEDKAFAYGKQAFKEKLKTDNVYLNDIGDLQAREQALKEMKPNKYVDQNDIDTTIKANQQQQISIASAIRKEQSDNFMVTSVKVSNGNANVEEIKEMADRNQLDPKHAQILIDSKVKKDIDNLFANGDLDLPTIKEFVDSGLLTKPVAKTYEDKIKGKKTAQIPVAIKDVLKTARAEMFDSEKGGKLKDLRTVVTVLNEQSQNEALDADQRLILAETAVGMAKTYSNPPLSATVMAHFEKTLKMEQRINESGGNITYGTMMNTVIKDLKNDAKPEEIDAIMNTVYPIFETAYNNAVLKELQVRNTSSTPTGVGTNKLPTFTIGNQAMPTFNDYDNLKSGDEYTAPDGSIRRKI